MKTTAEKFADWLNGVTEEQPEEVIPPSYPEVTDGGEVRKGLEKESPAEQFAEYINTLNIPFKGF